MWLEGPMVHCTRMRKSGAFRCFGRIAQPDWYEPPSAPQPLDLPIVNVTANGYGAHHFQY
ncbi:hypothetical protein ARSEF1564_007297 [Beauveria bassiana]